MNLEQTDPSMVRESDILSGIVIYLQCLGRSVDADTLVTGLPVTHEDFSIPDVPRALARIGFSSRIRHSKIINRPNFPLCILMNDGRLETLLGFDGETYVLAHKTLPDSVWYLTKEQMDEFYAGVYITAAPTVESLEKTYVGSRDDGHWFWGQLKKHRLLTAEVIIATLVANALAVAISLFALQVYDRVIPNASYQTLWVLAVGALIAIVFEVSLRISRARIIDDLGRQVELQASAELMTRLQGMRLSAREMGPATLGALLRDFASVREFFTASAVGSAADIPFTFIFLTLIYLIAGPIVWVVFTACCVIILFSFVSRKALAKISEDMQGANVAQSRLLNEITYGAETVKLNRAENRFQQKWEGLSDLISSKTKENRAVSSRQTFVSQGFQQTSYILAVVAGVYLVLAGDLTVGAIIAVSILSSRTIGPISQLSATLARWQQVKVSLTGLDQIVNAEQERSADRHYSKKTTLKGDIEMERLIYAYGEDQAAALNIPKLDLASGKTVAILGRNGSGKSTLLKLISGLYNFSEGDIRIDGLDIRQIDPVDLRRNIGYLPQDVTLFSGTLRDNLLLGPMPKTDEELDQALEFCGLKVMVDRHPLGLDMPVLDGGVGLSVGQRQSLGLARVYLADPQIVLLDEPTAAMDQMLERSVIANLKVWLAQKTCILTTHRTEIVSLCDSIAVLEAGRIATMGDRDTVLAQLSSSRPKEASQ